ncbi:hypothetical protein [Streptomyces sp. NPDC050804]|uniref:hypothetical protein n=1 Tax=unclassified Streptomyces TaxID=2593676 RepID=UPI00341CBEB2|nr:hypothetical protein OG214_21995 [Streptomyces sp. NBC_00872]
MSQTTTATAPETVEPKPLSLDATGLGVTADDVDAYTELAVIGIVGAGANNCGAVQDNAALRPETTVSLKPAVA